MKSILLSIIMIVFYQSIFAQSDYWTTIKTPTNISVPALHRYEYSANYLAFIEAQAANWLNEHSSNAVRVAPASRRYNCHAYAWHVKDGGNKVWLNAHDDHDDDHDDDPEVLKKYWTGSAPTYSQSNASKATVAFYGSCWQNTSNGWTNNCDHSAKVISYGVFESKWGAWPRYRHSPSDCPYVSSNLQYYAVSITGSNLICSSNTYSTLNISGASYNWSGNKVSISGNSSLVTATKTSNGSGWIKTQISSPYSGTTITSAKKTFWIGKPSFTIYGTDELMPRQPGMAVMQYSTDRFIQGVSNVNWSYTGLLDYITGDITKARYRAGNHSGMGFVYAMATNVCGQRENRMFYEVSGWYKVFPNPVNDILTIEIDKSKIPKRLVLQKIEIHLYNKMMSLMKKSTLTETSATINVSDLA